MASRSLRVIQIVPSYFPATYWGGPIFSTKMICDEVSKRPGFSVSVLTTDAAGPAVSQRVDSRGICFAYPVLFCRRIAGDSISLGLFSKLYRGISAADVVHITATFSFPTLPALLMARLLRKPVVWSPRGAVQATDGWQSSPRQFPKQLFLKVARKIATSQLTIHVTSECERAATQRYFPGVDFAIIPNGVKLPNLVRETRRGDVSLNLMFLGRVHPQKGVERLLEAMNNLPTGVSLDIYGTGDPAYLEHIRRISVVFSGRVRLHGEIHEAEKCEAFRKADLFVLPSFSENFGIVIAESLAHGVPVVTTTATPWADLGQRGCGLAIDAHSGDLSAAILRLAGQDLARMGAVGRRWIAEEFSPEKVGDAFAKLYRTKVAAFG
ncbi:glycosyltransferase [Novosphingobium sp. MW5]|nr:glycosyltransferase [Novosphingobium sp. MW5]